MTREELAARLYIKCSYKTGGDMVTIDPDDAFEQADKFLAYAAKEREKGEPKDHDCDGYKCQHISHYLERCNHNWCSINGGPTHCLHCGAPKVAELRRPREVWVRFWKDGRVMGASEQELDFDGVLFREVMPGEEG